MVCFNTLLPRVSCVCVCVLCVRRSRDTDGRKARLQHLPGGGLTCDEFLNAVGKRERENEAKLGDVDDLRRIYTGAGDRKRNKRGGVNVRFFFRHPA